tara:strand:- start:1866 stop:2654 length:789 start_codon:yes stop_codon:yes gene_type:complete
MQSKKILIVGIYSEIGTALNKLLLQNGYIVEGTSRDKKKLATGVSFFDLKDPDFKLIDKNYECVIICAGVNSIIECENNYSESEKINVTNTIKLISNAIRNNSFVVFLSSSTVFDGEKEFYKYTAKTNPKNNYGKFKETVEEYIIKKNNCCVLRLTKVMSKKTPILRKWDNNLKQGLPIKVFSNLFISPISIDEVVSSIQILIVKRKSGIFQLGGSKEFSYFEFANFYFKNFPYSSELIKKDFNKSVNLIKYNSLKTYLPND